MLGGWVATLGRVNTTTSDHTPYLASISTLTVTLTRNPQAMAATPPRRQPAAGPSTPLRSPAPPPPPPGGQDLWADILRSADRAKALPRKNVVLLSERHRGRAHLLDKVVGKRRARQPLAIGYDLLLSDDRDEGACALCVADARRAARERRVSAELASEPPAPRRDVPPASPPPRTPVTEPADAEHGRRHRPRLEQTRDDGARAPRLAGVGGRVGRARRPRRHVGRGRRDARAA